MLQLKHTHCLWKDLKIHLAAGEQLVAVSEMAGYFADFYSDCCLGNRGPCLENCTNMRKA